MRIQSHSGWSLLTAKTLLLATFLAFPVFHSDAAGLFIQILDGPTVGRVLRVEVDAPGDVGIENSLKNTSEICKGSGKRKWDLGLVKEAGFYPFRFFTAEGSRIVMVPILHETNPVPAPLPLKSDEDAALQKFIKLHSKATTLASWKAWPLREQLAGKIVNLTSTGTFFVLCPFEGLACAPAATSTLDLALDLAIEFEIFQVDQFRKQKSLSEAEAKLIKHCLVAAKTAKSVLGVKGKWDAAIASVEFFAAVVDNKDAQFSLGLLTDEAKKTKSLIMLFGHR